MQSLKNRVVVITGASRGVGAAAAKLFAKEDAKVVLNARNEELLHEIAESLETDESDRLVVPADIGTRDGMKTLVQAAIDRFGQIDVFINNAGLGVRKPITEVTEDEWDFMFNVNVKAIYYSFLELVPHMKKRGGGHIINVSSMASKAGRATLGPYGASKAAVNILSEGVGTELRNDNIKVSVLMPGSINTNFLGRVTEDKNPSGSKPRMSPVQVAEALVEMAHQDHEVWTSVREMRPLHTKSD